MEQIIEKILNKYISSGDYNGYPLIDFIENFSSIEEAKISLKKYINKNLIELYLDTVNPYIKRFKLTWSKKEQIAEIDKLPNQYEEDFYETNDFFKIRKPNEFSNYCLYPATQLLEKELGNKKEFLELPYFKKMLTFGKCQLEFIYFRIDVLDRYIADPRYKILYNDHCGSIYYDHEKNPEHPEDDTFLEHFGLAYNKETQENLITVDMYPKYAYS